MISTQPKLFGRSKIILDPWKDKAYKPFHLHVPFPSRILIGFFFTGPNNIIVLGLLFQPNQSLFNFDLTDDPFQFFFTQLLKWTIIIRHFFFKCSNIGSRIKKNLEIVLIIKLHRKATKFLWNLLRILGKLLLLIEFFLGKNM